MRTTTTAPDLAQSAGLLTCNQNHDRPALKGYGYDWQSYQVWNQGPRGPLDTGGDYRLSEDRAHGISPGVWGVVYEVGAFYSSGKGTAERAVALDADHLILDIEEVLKNTAPGGAEPAIRGCRDGGWSGPIHLTTYGAPSQNPEGGFWDYAMDLQSFLDTGGSILPQAYYAPQRTPTGRDPGYAAELCVAYYCDQVGIPRENLNLMIWPNGDNPIQTEVAHLLSGGLGCQMSVFLTETTTPDRFTALQQVTSLPPWGEPPPTEPWLPGTLIGDQHGIKAMCDHWRSVWPTKTKQNRDPNDLGTWGAIDKLERTLMILTADHDAWVRSG